MKRRTKRPARATLRPNTRTPRRNGSRPLRGAKVPRRLRALAGVDPRRLAPGTLYPCDDPRVGTVVPGGRSTPGGRVVACASRGPAQRGHDLFVGGAPLTPRQIAAARAFAEGEARRALRRTERRTAKDAPRRRGGRAAEVYGPRESLGVGAFEDARQLPYGPRESLGTGTMEPPRPLRYGPRESLGTGAFEDRRARPASLVAPAATMAPGVPGVPDGTITITFRDGVFFALGNTSPVYRELKEAGFRTWREGDGFVPWQTKNIEAAAKFRRYMDAAALLRLDQRTEAIAASRQAVGLQCGLLPAPKGRSYLPFQCAGIQYALAREGTLIGDDMGLGKTVQAIGVVNADPTIRAVLVVCPASLRTNWRREAERWLVRPFNVYVVEGNEPIPEEANFVILNYEILITRTVVSGTSGTGGTKTRRDVPSKPFTSAMARAWDLLVVDEAHRVKNEDAKQTVAIVGAEEYDKVNRRLNLTSEGLVHRSRRKVFLTGTPLPNRPIELWPVVHALDPKEFPNRYQFSVRYAAGHRTRFGWDETGSSNLEELQNRLRSTIMVRRLKTQVLTELPSKRREVVLLPAEVARDVMLKFASRYIDRKAKEQLRRGLEDFDPIDWTEVQPEELVDRLIEEMEARREEMERARAAGDPLAYDKAAKGLQNFLKVGFDEMSDLRREIARKKVPSVVEFVRDQLAAGVNKVVVMAHHHEVQDAMVKAFSQELGPEAVVLHRGGLDDATKQSAVDRFQNDPRVRVFVGSILASGVGITLTSASTMVFAELDWVPGNMTQAEDRIYRIGQTLPVTIYHLVVDGTLDAKLVDTLIQKQLVADSALDTERAALLSEVTLPEARGPKSPLEEWAATFLVGIANGTTTPQREPNAFARREIPVLARALATGRGLFDRQWRLAIALAMRAAGGSMTRVGGGPVRPPANLVEMWAADAIRQLAGDDADRAQEKNGIGFMAAHSATGHTLAALIDAQAMTDDNWREAVSIAKRYPGQVGSAPKSTNSTNTTNTTNTTSARSNPHRRSARQARSNTRNNTRGRARPRRRS